MTDQPHNVDILPEPGSLARMIDHTLLRPDASADEIIRLCEEARQFGFSSVCINPTHIPRCADLLRGSLVKVCSVVGFPLGATLADVKAYEAELAINLGAGEIDMVINIGALRDGRLELVLSDIRTVAQICHAKGALLKATIETALLTQEEKITACRLAMEANADFVKTSTGFTRSGATPEDVALIRSVVGPGVGVKASGGVRSWDDALKMIQAGATRLGASAGVQIIQSAGLMPPPLDPMQPTLA